MIPAWYEIIGESDNLNVGKKGPDEAEQQKNADGFCRFRAVGVD